MPETRSDQLILTDGTLHTPIGEAYRALRANISFSSVDQPVRTVVVTSAAPREGKTTTVINLGIIMAQAGSRVLLVDGDFRRPSLFEAFDDASLLHGAVQREKRFWAGDPPSVPGLSDVIVGSYQLEDVLVPTRFEQLWLLPAGARPPNPAELLDSDRMRTIISALATRADVVLIDSPPCLLYADAYLLSRLTDRVLYVLRAGSQDKAAQRRVQKQLEQAKAKLLGVVFNDAAVDETASGYSYYYPNGQKRRK